MSGELSLLQTTSCIAIASALFTFAIRQLSAGSAQLLQTPPPLPVPSSAEGQRYITKARKQRAAQLEWEQEKRRLLLSQDPFQLLDLPAELILAILSHCAQWPSTYAALVCTSARVQRFAFIGCLPRIPIHLISSQHVRSFNLFIRRPRKGIRVSSLIHHLWVTPLSSSDVQTVVALVRSCRGLRSLATNTYIVQESIELFDGAPGHSHCTDLTLLSTGSEGWDKLLSWPPAVTFLQQIRYLRLIGEEVSLPNHVVLPNLTHLSYGSTTIHGIIPDTSVGNPRLLRAGEQMLCDTQNYPTLKCVIATKSRSVGGLRISRMSQPKRKGRDNQSSTSSTRIRDKRNIWFVELPPDKTELEIWSDNAFSRGLWALC
ncbi:hypothetical protein CPB83DRAFT_862068 [Crepidotus variabilis]|uniref:Uncharacterized protein n=1 Tax=Crepidotus variabilis TaxID=179855 RepID=A0A9P6E750_9AGAR|nr:hypothetical protein CPB83DRAFT_862068 [Crepidotus variabilis]